MVEVNTLALALAELAGIASNSLNGIAVTALPFEIAGRRNAKTTFRLNVSRLPVHWSPLPELYDETTMGKSVIARQQPPETLLSACLAADRNCGRRLHCPCR